MANLMMAVAISASLVLNPLNVMDMRSNIDKNIEKLYDSKTKFHVVGVRGNLFYKIKDYNKNLSDQEILLIMNSVKKHSKKYNVPEKLIYAIIAAESRFNVKCVGTLDDTGLMQIRAKYAPGWARAMGIEYKGKATLFDIQKNIQMGTYILKFLVDKYEGNLYQVLIGYNWGFGYVDKAVDQGKPLPSGYVNLVKKHYRNLFNTELEMNVLAVVPDKR